MFFHKQPVVKDNPNVRMPLAFKLAKGLAVNTDVLTVLDTSAWKGRRCFVIGGGPSLDSFDFNRLKGEKVITTCRSFEFYDSDINYFMDSHFASYVLDKKLLKTPEENDKLLERWNEYTGLQTCLCPIGEIAMPSGVYVVRRNRTPGVYTDIRSGIYGGNNSGLGAVMLGIALGCAEVYMLGFDLGCTDKTHFHSGYAGERNTMDRQKAKQVVFAKKFNTVARYMLDVTKVYNCNDNSIIKRIPYRNVDEVLN